MNGAYEVTGLNEVGIVGMTAAMYSAFIMYDNGEFRKKGADALVLYLHYMWTALRQDTNQPRALDSYCMTGLGWGRDKLRGAKEVLLDMGVVEYIQKRTESGRMGDFYVRLKYLKAHPGGGLPPGGKPARGEQPTNASLNKGNASLNKKKNTLVYSEDFILFWNAYPRRKGIKTGKNPAFKVWRKLGVDFEMFDKIITAVEAYKKTEEWQEKNGQYIPHASTWLFQKRWEDEIDEPADSFDERRQRQRR